MTDWMMILLLSGSAVALAVLVYLMYQKASSSTWQDFSRSRKKEWQEERQKPQAS